MLIQNLCKEHKNINTQSGWLDYLRQAKNLKYKTKKKQNKTKQKQQRKQKYTRLKKNA